MGSDVLAALTAIVGEQRVLTGDAVAAVEFPWGTHAECSARAIVEPETIDEVAAILRCCNEARQTVVPFGGLTNLVQGCATSPDDIVLSLKRLNRIESVDASAGVLTAEAGVTLQQAQDAAASAGLFFPVDIGARNNCQLGGLVANNAGGNKVIRYGMTRDTVLGLEAVLADGTVISSLNRFIKNNSGFDLKHMFIGSEGVLGVITRLVFRLRATASSQNVALVACEDFGAVVATLEIANKTLSSTLSAFEVMWNSFYELAWRSPTRRCRARSVRSRSCGTVFMNSPSSREGAWTRHWSRVPRCMFSSKRWAPTSNKTCGRSKPCWRI
jgi:FAD/FMN-containing dehydrogenase